MACQPDPSGEPALTELVARDHGGKVFPVHRIDRPASGLVVFARTSEAAARLSELFREHSVERRYWAIVGVEPSPQSGTLENRLVHRPATNKAQVVARGGRPAELKYELVARSERYWLLDVTLTTGRHHQIRVQLAARGWPIRGDLKYGARRSIPGGGIGLHAHQLTFVHPFTKERIELIAPAPEDNLWQALTAGTAGGDA